MRAPVLLLILLNFASVMLLTAAFFKRDARPGIRWWATSVPFILCPALVIAAYFANLAPITPKGWTGPTGLAAVVLSAASIALIFYTWGTHRVRLALYHQPGDVPQEIVTSGAYRWIRHPFYTSYLMLYLAAVLFFPHWGTIALAVYMFIALNITAAGEEKRLSASAFGAEYREYLGRTGRFLPRLATWPHPGQAVGREEPT
jgi:protein-S-isoprenylcysteine O-methyltransferase Ste14